MKKIGVIFCGLLLCLSFTSCISHNELNETAIVQAIGLDYEEEQFLVTMQIYSPKGAGGSTAIDTSKNNSTIITAKGKTIASAMSNATLVQGNDIFTGHNRILVLGKGFSEQGIQNVFSYFNRSALTRQNVEVLMASGRAQDIITTNIDQGILAAETIEKMVKNNKENGMIYFCPYFKMSKNMNLYNGCIALPMIAPTEEETGNREEEGEQEGGSPDEKAQSGEQAGGQSEKIQNVGKLSIEQTAIFKDYRVVEFLDRQETRGLMLLSNMITDAVMVGEGEALGQASVGLYSCKTRLVPEIRDGKAVFHLKAKLRGSLDEVLLPQEKRLDEGDIHQVAENCKEKLTGEAESCFRKAVNKNKSDILYLEDLLKKYEYDFWKAHQDNFDRVLEEAQLMVEMELVIDRVGMETDEKFS